MSECPATACKLLKSNPALYITQDEYENLYEYLYSPYIKMGGNGSAKRVMQEVEKLPIHKAEYRKEA